MDLVNRADLESLTSDQPRGVCVSLFMPTQRVGNGTPADRARWKNLLAAVESALDGQQRRADLDALLGPAWTLHRETMEWQAMSDGLVMFLRPGWHRAFRIPASVPELAVVGDRPVIGPLLRLLSGDEHFLLLALSQRRIRLMEGSRHVVEDVHLADVPTSLREAVAAREPRSDTMARPAASASRPGPAVFYGHGAGDDHRKQNEVQRFLRVVSTGLRDVLSGQTSPLVLVGLEALVSAYRDVNDYPYVVPEAVLRSSDDLSAAELHALAWPLVEQRLRQERAQVMEVFRQRHGTGTVSTDPATVLEAAEQGRVETLFVKADPWYWERVPAEQPRIVRLGADEQYADCERIEAAAAAALHSGSRIYATSQSVVPRAEVAAVFRY